MRHRIELLNKFTATGRSAAQNVRAEPLLEAA
jgi:hypothetical protein